MIQHCIERKQALCLDQEHGFSQSDIMKLEIYFCEAAILQRFPIQILLIFLRFELPPNFIFQCYRPQTWQFYLFFPALFISDTHKVPGLKFNGG